MAVSAFRQLEAVPSVLRRSLLLLVVPWVLMTLSVAWRPNCAYWTGIGISGVLVPPSIVLGVALAYALTGARVRRARVWVVGIGLVIAVGGVVVDLGFHSQLFTYNHVFGGVLGPIYDEELAIRPGVFAFRTLTLLWAVMLFALGRALRASGQERRTWLNASLGASLLVGATYLLAVPLGIQQSHRSLAAALGSRSEVGRFEIFYDAETLELESLRRVEDELLYRYHQLEGRLGLVPSQPIRVYLYPDADTKGALIGSRETSVVPVWLPAPQIHMLVERVPSSAAHELVHVFAREFGMPGLRASPAVGLVEGLAVALEPPDGLPGPTDLVLAAQQAEIQAQGLEQNPAEVARATMSPLGFWTTRAGVAYSTSGAFVAWLLDRYGSERFRDAYRSGNVERAYGQPLTVLAQSWAQSLDGRAASPQAIELAEDLLTRRSLFEQRCPHHVPAFVRDARTGVEALETGELGIAQSAYAEAWNAEPMFETALIGWSAATAARGEAVEPDSLRRMEAASLDSLSGPHVASALADLHRIAGNDADADRLYADALRRMPSYAPLAYTLLRLRSTLSKDALLTIASHPEAPALAATRAETIAPVHAALLWDQAGDPRRAWEVARQWNLESQSASSLDRAVLTSLQARLAYWAEDLSAADSLASTSAQAYRQEQHSGPAALANDWAARARWRRSRPSRPQTVPE